MNVRVSFRFHFKHTYFHSRSAGSADNAPMHRRAVTIYFNRGQGKKIKF